MGVGVRQVGGRSLAELERRLGTIANGRTRQKALGAVARVLTAEQRQAFAREASPAGVPWAPLARWRPGKLLHVGGALERAATRPFFRGNTVAYLLPIYGARQNFGFPEGATPARPFMALDPLPPATFRRLARAMGDVVDASFR